MSKFTLEHMGSGGAGEVVIVSADNSDQLSTVRSSRSWTKIHMDDLDDIDALPLTTLFLQL